MMADVDGVEKDVMKFSCESVASHLNAMRVEEEIPRWCRVWVSYRAIECCS